MDSIEFDAIIRHPRTIIHIDVDCFYAQVEMLRHPELENKPLGVQQKNMVVTRAGLGKWWRFNKLSSLFYQNIGDITSVYSISWKTGFWW